MQAMSTVAAAIVSADVENAAQKVFAPVLWLAAV